MLNLKALKEAATLADTTHDPSWRKHVDAFRAISSPSTILSLIERCEELEGALRAIAEGNLGDEPWQANYEKIRHVASVYLPKSEVAS